MHTIRFTVLIAILSFSSFALGAALSSEDIPKPLQPWVDWVLLDHQDRACPHVYNSSHRRCAWPVRLELRLDQQGGTFSQSWRVYAKSRVKLPGDGKLWPQDVQLNGETALVASHEGRPSLWLEVGQQRIEGRFVWDRLPKTLPIPAASALVTLTVEGRVIPIPDVDSNGHLWLRERDSDRKTQAPPSERLELQVFRRLIDDNPLRLITHIEMEVSGAPREVLLDGALLDDFIPLRLDSRLPARLEREGRLRLQLRPGHWSVEFTARHPGDITRIGVQESAPPWPQEEVWVFDARPHLRLVELKGAPMVDPRQTKLPEPWRNLPAYRLTTGDMLDLEVVRRGDPEPEPDQLSLERNLWLDFSGDGYTLQDRITGSMTRGWRLEANEQIALGRVAVDGTPQFITRLSGTDKRGLEVRRGAISLSADSRYLGEVHTLPVTGWGQDFQQVRANLHLPPGWKLFSVSGVDNVPNSWLQRWTLLDLFIVLIVAIAVGRLWGWPWGVLALVTLGLIWHEPGAPRYIWLNILAAVALLRVLPAGRIQFLVRWYRNASLVALVLVALPFMVQEVRTGLYPQLEYPWRSVGAAEGAAPATAEKQGRRSVERYEADILAEYKSMAPAEKRASSRAPFVKIDPKANIQTGPGLPRWQWASIPLSWQGPVDKDQTITLSLLSPGINLVLNLISVLLLAGFSLRVFNPGELLRRIPRVTSHGAVLLLVLGLLGGSMVQDAGAEFPTPEMLKQLEQRLLQAPECLPQCAQIARLRLDLSDQHIHARLEVYAQDESAIPLPIDVRHWAPQQVLIDGAETQALFRSASGPLWIQVEKGRHLVQFSGVLTGFERLQLPLALKPHHVEVNAQGWTVAGVHEDGVPDQQLQFTRIQGDTEQAGAFESAALPPFVSVERTLQLGLDWHVRTRIVRSSPTGVPVVLQIPLLPGESVLSAGIRVKQGKVLVNMGPEQKQLQWSSRLEQNQRIVLSAGDDPAWSELWRADIGPIWHVELSGIPVVHHQDPSQRWLPEWRPWPGEQVQLDITRPEGVAGQTITIDRSHLRISTGRRATEANLALTIRSSQGGRHRLILPEQVRLQSVSIDGVAQPIRQQGRQVDLPIRPGKQDIRMNWRRAEGIHSRLKTPEMDLGAASVNSSITVELGRDRWVLATGGPRLGPAVLFWGVLLVIVLIAIGLARIRLTPLGYWQWVLLGIGLSQAPSWIAVIVAGWLLALGLRARIPEGVSKFTFNTVQLGLVLLTLSALIALFYVVQQGLLGVPEMQIAGNRSYAHELNWYQDRIQNTLPRAWVLSVPLLVYRVLMLAWALWLAFALLGWLRWGWACFSDQGIWRAIQLEIKRRRPNSQKKAVTEPQGPR
ncbi:MAG: lysostaphin resistance A-like protein [Pseudomonadota bacterium]